MNLQEIKKHKLALPVSVAAAVLAVISIILIIRSFSRISTDDAYIEGRTHTIASKIPGTVRNVYISDNQDVNKGDLLVEIDPPDYELRVSQAQADLEAENSRLLDANAGIEAEMANLEIQQIALNQANLDRQRADALYEKNVMPKEQHEKVTTVYNQAVASVKAATQKVEKTKTTKNLEESLIKQRQAVLDAANLNLSYTKIAAPSSGHITLKSVEVGNQIQPGQPLMAIVELNDIWIVANYKETELKKIRPGQPVLIKVDTYSGRTFTGRVDSIMAGTGAVFSLFPPENALGNYVKVVQRIPVKIVFDKGSDSTHILRVGMSCVPTIITNKNK